MTLFQKMTKPIFAAGLLCLSLGVANADVYLQPAGTLTNYTITSGTNWSFTWDSGAFGNTLNGIVFNMYSTNTPNDPVVLTLYQGSTSGDVVGIKSLSLAGFCTQYGEGCGENSTLAPIQFTFYAPASMTDGTYVAALTYAGDNEAGTYTAAFGTETGPTDGSATPEPGTLALMGGALIAFGMIHKHGKEMKTC